MEFAGWGGGNGYTVTLRHRANFKTMYNHLSRFGKGIRPGAPVKQRRVIGYVGTTGLSTGPHLDYRVVKDGRFVNPLKQTFLPGKPISPPARPSWRRAIPCLGSSALPWRRGRGPLRSPDSSFGHPQTAQDQGIAVFRSLTSPFETGGRAIRLRSSAGRATPPSHTRPVIRESGAAPGARGRDPARRSDGASGRPCRD